MDQWNEPYGSKKNRKDLERDNAFEKARRRIFDNDISSADMAFDEPKRKVTMREKIIAKFIDPDTKVISVHPNGEMNIDIKIQYAPKIVMTWRIVKDGFREIRSEFMADLEHEMRTETMAKVPMTDEEVFDITKAFLPTLTERDGDEYRAASYLAEQLLTFDEPPKIDLFKRLMFCYSNFKGKYRIELGTTSRGFDGRSYIRIWFKDKEAASTYKLSFR